VDEDEPPLDDSPGDEAPFDEPPDDPESDFRVSAEDVSPEPEAFSVVVPSPLDDAFSSLAFAARANVPRSFFAQPVPLK
jgi:hypothetical protein